MHPSLTSPHCNLETGPVIRRKGENCFGFQVPSGALESTKKHALLPALTPTSVYNSGKMSYLLFNEINFACASKAVHASNLEIRLYINGAMGLFLIKLVTLLELLAPTPLLSVAFILLFHRAVLTVLHSNDRFLNTFQWQGSHSKPPFLQPPPFLFITSLSHLPLEL